MMGKRKINAMLTPLAVNILKHSVQASLLTCALLLAACDKPAPATPKAAETPRGWDIPTDPQEKAAYDYAHSLKLPDSVPKPVPFDFNEAERKEKKGGPNVSEQYFDHLCKTEGGEYIFKTVENVEGVFQMRPRSAPGKLDYDRYAPEEPTGLGYSNDINTYGDEFYVPAAYIQPMRGVYLFFEKPTSHSTQAFLRFNRRVNDDPPPGHRGASLQTSIGTDGQEFSLPFMVIKDVASSIHSKYGYTWRGIKRERDRELSIGGGEYLIVDLGTNEVLAVKRRFKLSGHDKNTQSHIWWANAKPCDSEVLWRKGHTPSPIPIDRFVKQVLKPTPGINDPYIPKQHQRATKEEAK